MLTFATYENGCHAVWKNCGCDSEGGSQGGRGAQALNNSYEKTQPDKPGVRLEIVKQAKKTQLDSKNLLS